MEFLRFNTDKPKDTLQVVLGDTTYIIRVVWYERLRAWYMDVSLPDGTGVSYGNRIASGGAIVADLNRHDDTAEAGGVLFGLGKDLYAREDLGTPDGINVAFLTRTEFEEFEASFTSSAIQLQVT